MERAALGAIVHVKRRRGRARIERIDPPNTQFNPHPFALFTVRWESPVGRSAILRRTQFRVLRKRTRGFKSIPAEVLAALRPRRTSRT